MPARKRKEIEADDGSYAGSVLGAFDRMASGETPASEIQLELSPAAAARLAAITKKFQRSMQTIVDRSGSQISISDSTGKKLAEFKPKGLASR